MSDRYKLREIVDDDERLNRFYLFMDPARLAPGGNVRPHWLLDGVSFWYVEGAPHETAIMRVDGATGSVAPLLDIARTRQALAALLGRELPYRGLPFDSLVEVSCGVYRFTFEGADYVLSTDSYAVRAADARPAFSHDMQVVSRVLGLDPTGREAPRSYRRPIWLMEPMVVTEAPCPDRRWLASIRDGNIVLRAPVDDRTVALTTGGTPEFAWDIEAPRVKQGAGGHLTQHVIDPWSPDGNRLFAIAVDRRAVPDLPVIRYLKREEECCAVKIQRAGGPIDIAHPHVIDVLSKRARRFEVGDTTDQFITLVGWLPDGSEVLFTRHARDFKSVDLLAGNPLDGSIRIVIAERAATFVALQHDVIFFGDNHITILADGSGLIWRSARSGWNHLYLYGVDGTLRRALTHGEFPVIDVVAVDQARKLVYFTAHHDQSRPYDTHLCRVALEGGEVERLTRTDGVNAVSMSPQLKTFTVVNSRPDRPFVTQLCSSEGKQLATVQRADVRALEALGHVASEEFTATAADGKTTLWGVMHKPAGFDPNKKYPVIDRLYAGPQVAFVSHDFSFGNDYLSRLDRALAQLGYLVISVDARGTPERSKAFHDVVYRNWGRHEIPDHVATLRQLAQRHAFIDLQRVGVWGHSWGGSFTIRALAQAPEVYHVGVASAPGSDVYDSILYEPYLDLPTRAKAAYDYASNHELISRITGKLMLIAGTSDSYIYPHTLEIAHFLIQAGIDHELVVLPEAYHTFVGKHEEYFVHKVVKHFELHLKRRQGSAPGGGPGVRRDERAQSDS